MILVDTSSWIRSAPNIWLLAQAGPGIVTANIVPPYMDG